MDVDMEGNKVKERRNKREQKCRTRCSTCQRDRTWTHEGRIRTDAKVTEVEKAETDSLCQIEYQRNSIE